MAPEYKDRSEKEILSQNIYHDAVGYGYRAASWIDYVERTGNGAAIYYACIDGRLSIEHLIFELIVVCSEPSLTEDDYKKCLRSPRKIDKLLTQLIPEYKKLVAFSGIIQSLIPGVPKINEWDIKELMKNWGSLSNFLHWTGAAVQTSENSEWQSEAFNKAKSVILPLWSKLSSGQSGAIRVDSMSQNTKDIWEKFRSGEIDAQAAKFRLEVLGP
ncbi:hypothetical protein [Zhongshania sp.]|uniref:hypothetical protein n=1 Tax=Zhongshania sp. TaxID=1971902 RepID=UPI0035631DE9